jgi:hypothetical protein
MNELSRLPRTRWGQRDVSAGMLLEKFLEGQALGRRGKGRDNENVGRRFSEKGGEFALAQSNRPELPRREPNDRAQVARAQHEVLKTNTLGSVLYIGASTGVSS